MYKTKKSLHACTAASFIVLSKYSGDTVCKHNTRPRSCGRLGLAPSWGPRALDPQDPSPHDLFFTPKSHSQMKSKAEGESSKIVLSRGPVDPEVPLRRHDACPATVQVLEKCLGSAALSSRIPLLYLWER